MMRSFIVAFALASSGFGVETPGRTGEQKGRSTWAAPFSFSAQQAAAVESRLRVTLPQVDVELLVSDRPTAGTGTVREITLPPRRRGTVSD